VVRGSWFVVRGEVGGGAGEGVDAASQGDEVARGAAAAADSCGDAFDVGAVAEDGAKLGEGGFGGGELFDRVLALADLGDVLQRVAEPVAQEAGAHGGLGAIDGGDEGAFDGVAAEGAEDFEGAEADGVDEEMMGVLEGVRGLEVFEGGFLGVVEVCDEAAGSAEGEVFFVFVAEAGEGGDGVVGFEGLGGVVWVELPGGAGAEGNVELDAEGFEPFGWTAFDCISAFGVNEFAGAEAGEFVDADGEGAGEGEEFSGGEFAPGDGGKRL